MTRVKLYLEDLTPGMRRAYGPVEVTREAIIRFARDFDPQPFHLDEEAAHRSPFGGLVASGWHTASLCMRMVVEGLIAETHMLGSPGADELRFVKPVRPGDVLRLNLEVLAVTPSRSKPNLGSVRLRYEARNQHEEVVLTMIGIGLVARCPSPDP